MTDLSAERIGEIRDSFRPQAACNREEQLALCALALDGLRLRSAPVVELLSAPDHMPPTPGLLDWPDFKAQRVRIVPVTEGE